MLCLYNTNDKTYLYLYGVNPIARYLEIKHKQIQATILPPSSYVSFINSHLFVKRVVLLKVLSRIIRIIASWNYGYTQIFNQSYRNIQTPKMLPDLIFVKAGINLSSRKPSLLTFYIADDIAPN